MLVQVIDEVIRYSFGEISATIIYDYFKKRNIPLDKIPDNLDFFSMELRMLLGSGRGQILGSAPLLERAILKAARARARIGSSTLRMCVHGRKHRPTCGSFSSREPGGLGEPWK
jgi:hypothetical protein